MFSVGGQPNRRAADGANYKRYRERKAKAYTVASRSGRNIGDIPNVLNPERKDRCRFKLEPFCREYFPRLFYSSWSQDHLVAIDKIETAVLKGGNFAWAMPRGGGKDALVLAGSLWAKLYGHQNFVALIGPDEELAIAMLDSEKSELENNDLLLEDFPEVVFPIREIGGIAQRANGQLWKDQRTQIEWKEKRITFPTIKGSVASSAHTRVRGITGSIRGWKFSRPDGRTVRPGVVFVNDCQTDESAKSPSQVDQRIKIINGAILGLAGPGCKIACVLPCTVVEPDDVADRLLDRSNNPTWQGERHKMLYGWPPAAMDKWEIYKKLRNDAIRANHPCEVWNKYYSDNRNEMDGGLRAAWESRKTPEDISAIQHAMNLWCDKSNSFFAEYQNEPVKKIVVQDTLTVNQITAKANGMERGIVPDWATRVVSFIDVQKDFLPFGVLALDDYFTGHICDYGAYPDQHADYFTKATVRQKLMACEKAERFEEAIFSGLGSLASQLLSREWTREDGSTQKIERCLIDAHWGEVTEIVRVFCKSSTHAAILVPSFGIYIGARTLPMSEKAIHPGDKAGTNWMMPKPKPGKVRHVSHDSNYWKTFLHSRFAQAPGGQGCFSIFGAPEDHQMLGEQVTSEFPVLTRGRGRELNEWQLRPGGTDNELLDIFVGCCVAGSIGGSALAEMKMQSLEKKRKVRFSELQRKW